MDICLGDRHDKLGKSEVNGIKPKAPPCAWVHTEVEGGDPLPGGICPGAVFYDYFLLYKLFSLIQNIFKYYKKQCCVYLQDLLKNWKGYLKLCI